MDKNFKIMNKLNLKNEYYSVKFIKQFYINKRTSIDK